MERTESPDGESPASPPKRRSHLPLSILSTLASVINMLLPLVLVRLLSPQEIGVFKIFFLYLMILPAFSLAAGLRSGLAYWAGQTEGKTEALKISAQLFLLSALSLTLLALLSQHFLSSILGWSSTMAFVFCLAVFGTISSPFFEEALYAIGRIWTGAIFFSSFEIVRTLSIITVAYSTRDLLAVFITHAFLINGKAILGYLYGIKLGIVGRTTNTKVFRAVWRYALPVSIAWVFGVFLSYADQFVLSTFIAPAEFALYAVGCLSVPPLLILEQSVTRVMIPELAAAFSAGKEREAAELFRRAIDTIAFFIVPAVAGLFVFADPIIDILFTHTYAASADYLRFFAFSYLALAIPYDSVARAKGEAAWLTRTFIGFSLATLALTFTGTLLWGARGALVGTMAGGAAMRIYSLVHIRRVTGWSTARMLPLDMLRHYALIALFLSLAAFAAAPLFASQIYWFLCCGPIFAGVYLLSGWICSRARPQRRNDRRVMMLTQSLHIGGLERMVLSLSKRLQQENDWSVFVFAYDHGGPQQRSDLTPEFRKQSIAVTTYKKPRGFSPRVVLKIIQQVRTSRISIIHCHDLGGLIYGALAKVLLLGRVRLIITQHSFIHLDRQKRYVLYEKFFTRFADVVTVVSEETKRTYLSLGHAEEKILLIENGIEFNSAMPANRGERILERTTLIERIEDREWRERLTARRESYWLIYLARLFPRKGQDHALRLWNALSSEARTRCTLLFVGPEAQAGERQRLIEEAQHCADASSIIFAGASTEPDRWLRGGDIYLSSSEYEGMPLGPLEAVGAAIPALLSEIPGHAFLKTITRQYNLLDPGQGAHELETMLGKVISEDLVYHEQLRRHAGEIRATFSPDEMARRYARLYNDLLKTSAPLEEGNHRLCQILS